MIRVSNLSRWFGDVQAVNEVSFEIGKGEIVGLLGHNGAGKTTIMKMLTGFLEPSSGTVEVLGEDLTGNMDAIRAGIGYLPESSPTWPEMSVAEYLEFVASMKGIDKASIQSEVKRAIDRTELGAKALARIAELSRGYRQRVGVAQAILGSPSIIILDEPTNGLDPTQVQHMRALIKELAKDATVILSTHVLQEVQAVCDRVLIIRDGALAIDRRLDDLTVSNTILLSVNADLTKVKEVLLGHFTISDINPTGNVGDVTQYRLSVSPEYVAEVLPDIARTCLDNGVDLYGLQPQMATIENVFEEIAAEASAPVATLKEAA